VESDEAPMKRLSNGQLLLQSFQTDPFSHIDNTVAVPNTEACCSTTVPVLFCIDLRVVTSRVSLIMVNLVIREQLSTIKNNKSLASRSYSDFRAYQFNLS
jgi:hypothetical protein